MSSRAPFQIFSNQCRFWQKWQVAGWKGLKPNNRTDLKLSERGIYLLWLEILIFMENFFWDIRCADLFTFQTWWPMQFRQSHAPRTQVWPSISKARSCKINILNRQSSVFGSSSMDASLNNLITCQSSFQFSQFSHHTLSIQPYVTSFLMERYLIDVISPVLKTCPCRCHSSFNQVCTPPP